MSQLKGMSQLKCGDLGISQSIGEVSGPVTPLPACEPYLIIPPSLSLKQRLSEDGSVPPTRRSVYKNRELMDFVSGEGEPFCPQLETDSSQAIGLVYINDKQLPPMEFLWCAIMQYVRIRGVVPGCLCVSSELRDGVKRDTEDVFGKSFDGTISFPRNQEIPVHFFSTLSRDHAMGYAKDRF